MLTPFKYLAPFGYMMLSTITLQYCAAGDINCQFQQLADFLFNGLARGIILMMQTFLYLPIDLYTNWEWLYLNYYGNRSDSITRYFITWGQLAVVTYTALISGYFFYWALLNVARETQSNYVAQRLLAVTQVITGGLSMVQAMLYFMQVESYYYY